MRSVSWTHGVPLSATFAAYSHIGAGVSLKRAIFAVAWALRARGELLRTPFGRSSENKPSMHSAEYGMKKGQAQGNQRAPRERSGGVLEE